MRSITRHALRPGCTADALDDLDVVATPEIAALCRATVDDSLPQLEQLRAWKKLKEVHGLSICRFFDLADASHFLMSERNVYLIRL